MPSAPIVDRYNPSFQRFPVQNNRTGFKPVSLPLILVVPGRKLANGTVLSNSDVFNVRFYIADAPEPAIVAGYDHKGLVIPDTSLYELNINRTQLSDVLIILSGLSFYSPSDPNTAKTYENAVDGDYFTYTTIGGGITSNVVYHPDADYYDVSKFSIDVEDLPRPFQYLFIWECQYYRRIALDASTASIKGAFCITDDIRLSRYTFPMYHPGDVHNEMFRKTPALYFKEGMTLKDDALLAFYRPFSDILQDAADEQSLLYGINFINKIPAQLVPYLAYLIGWDLPNYPGASDNLRRSILYYAVQLQKLKGTRRAINELFEIFGFTINLANLWYSTDGKRLVAPGERTKNPSDYIAVNSVCQIEPMIASYSTDSFGKYQIPLLYKATDNITLNAYIVKNGTTTEQLDALITDLTADPDKYAGQCATSAQGFLLPAAVTDIVSGNPDVLQYSEALINYETGQVEVTLSSANPVLSATNIIFDKVKNIVDMAFDHYLTFNDSKLYMFATYKRLNIVVPSTMSNLRSNRFDVELLLEEEQIPEMDLIEFLMNFLYRLKAFHSLLRKIKFKLTFSEVYNVTDYCSDVFNNRYLPPGTMPEEVTGCKEPDTTSTKSDLRDLLYDLLTEEHAAWKAYDDTHQDTQIDSPVPVNVPEGTTCQFTEYGQDRVLQADLDTDQNEDTREKLCSLTQPSPEFCFKGRVKDDVSVNPRLILPEIVRCKPCALGHGYGSYWLMPIIPFSDFDQNGSFLGRKIRQYDDPTPDCLHYTDRPSLFSLDLTQLLAYQRPQLEIQKSTMNFPSHRYISGGNLLDDYTSIDWMAKPYDYPDNDLNAELIVGTNGDEYLVYDSAALTYYGNGLTPDVSAGEHEDRSFNVTHTIYMNTDAGHPAITLDDSVVITSDTSISLGTTTDSHFPSFNPDCLKDYIDGYPASSGRFSVDMSEFDFDRDGGTDVIGDALGLPKTENLTGLTLLFTFGSQIELEESDYQYGFYKGYRNDCGCLLFECGTGATTGATTGSSSREKLESCSLSHFRQSDGSYDFNCDQLETITRLILEEYVGTCSTLSDGEIEDSLNVNPCPLTDGTLKYKDDYGVIYESTWTTVYNGNDTFFDISLVTKSPRVPGEPDQGYVKNLKTYRRGVITTMRYVFQLHSSSYDLLAKWEDQEVGFFQSNVSCGDVPFTDDFCHYFDCMTTDELGMCITVGPHWTSDTCVTGSSVVWADLIIDSNGVVTGFDVPTGSEPFIFVDVWH